MQCFLCGVGMLSHPYKYSIGFPSELNLGSARRSRTSQETSERSGARQVRRKGGVSNTVIMTRVINFKLTHSAVQTAASGHYRTFISPKRWPFKRPLHSESCRIANLCFSAFAAIRHAA